MSARIRSVCSKMIRWNCRISAGCMPEDSSSSPAPEPFELLQRRHVTLVNPDPRNSSPRGLADAATYVRRLWKSHLRRSLLPDTLTDGIGTITKPVGW